MRPQSTFIVILGLALISCSKFQYATLESDLKRNDRQEFTIENDTLQITYGYSGSNGPFRIDVYNKHHKPIYIDWKKSSFILNGIRYPYWNDESTLQATNSELTIQWTRGITTTNGEITGSIRKEEQVSFIPPQSKMSITPLYLKTEAFTLPEARDEQKEKIVIDNVQHRFARYTYAQENAPLKFRSFIAYSQEVDFKEAHYLDNEFWIKEIVTTFTKPVVMARARQDQFHITDHTDYGQFMSTLLGLAVLAALLGAAATQ